MKIFYMKIMNFKKLYNILLILPIITGFNQNNLLGTWKIKKSSCDNSIFKNDCNINFDINNKFTLKQSQLFGLTKKYSGLYQKNPFFNNFHININKLDYSFNDFIIMEKDYDKPKIEEYKYYTDFTNSPYILYETNNINNTLYIEKFKEQKPDSQLIICHIMIVSNIILTSYLIYLYFNLLNLIYRNIMHN